MTTTTTTTAATRKIVVALSGGVDSSVAAYLLKKKYHTPPWKIIGLHMSNWNNLDEAQSSSSSNSFCVQSEQDATDARSVCDVLGIDLQRVSFSSEYWTDVFVPFVEGMGDGRTPNPDVRCNSHVKFGAMTTYATEKLGASMIATGHYARLFHRRRKSSDDITGCNGIRDVIDDYYSWMYSWGRTTNDDDDDDASYRSPLLCAGADSSKDQSYFLCGVNGRRFDNVLFPLGHLTKSTRSSGSSSSVRDLATIAGLPTATKRDSMGICFIGKRRFPEFISEYLEEAPREGNFVCIDTGQIIGTHNGHSLLTLGQRARISGLSSRYFVARKDPITNTVYICSDTHHPALYSDECELPESGMNWIGGGSGGGDDDGGYPPTPLMERGRMRAECRVRHLQPLVSCEVIWNQNERTYTIQFDRPMRSITPGQVAAIYVANGLVCLGGGTISKHGPTYHERGLSLPSRLHPAGHNDDVLVSYGGV